MLRKIYFCLFIVIILITPLILSACNTSDSIKGQFASIPVGLAYAEGDEIYFSHTEASDEDVAEKLTKMMNSPVLFVPSLALIPPKSAAKVYVFENGVKGKGPFGFQVDVFDAPPQTKEYSPLRNIHLVIWKDGVQPVIIKSEAELLTAAENNQLTITKTNIIVNMPFMTWNDGKR